MGVWQMWPELGVLAQPGPGSAVWIWPWPLQAAEGDGPWSHPTGLHM